MQHSNNRKQLSASVSLAVTLGLLAAFSEQSAQAGITFFDATADTAASLGMGAVTTDPYPAGDPFTLGPPDNPGPIYGILPSPFSVAAGANILTFTAQGAPKGASSFTNDPNSKSDPTSTDNSTRQYDISSDHVIETIDLALLHPTAPLQIDFQQGVTGFGFNAEDYGGVLETFTVTAYENGKVLGVPFQTPVIDSAGPNPGKSAFLGAQTTNGDYISELVISSTATMPDSTPGNPNDFVFGPVTVLNPGSPVPEASTSVSSGLGLLLIVGFVWSSRRRKAAKTAA